MNNEWVKRHEGLADSTEQTPGLRCSKEDTVKEFLVKNRGIQSPLNNYFMIVVIYFSVACGESLNMLPASI